MRTRVVGILGRRGSGKDAVFRALDLLLFIKGRTVRRFSFADALKQEIADALGVPVSWIERRKSNQDVRRLLQLWGTEIRRIMFGNSYWTSKLVSSIGSFIDADPSNIAVVTDVRFWNEYQSLTEKFGTNAVTYIRVIDPRQPPNEDTHATETELAGAEVNATILNDHTEPITDLINRVRLVLDYMEQNR